MRESSLQHHGIIGMRWGVRRTPEELARAAGRPYSKSKLPKKKVAADQKKPAESPKKKTLGDLSDEELKRRISRLELEKKYKDLAKSQEKPKTQRGRDFCLEVLENIGKNSLTNLGTQATNHILGDAINRIAGVSSDDAAHRIVNPQKGQSDKK